MGAGGVGSSPPREAVERDQRTGEVVNRERGEGTKGREQQRQRRGREEGGEKRGKAARNDGREAWPEAVVGERPRWKGERAGATELGRVAMAREARGRGNRGTRLRVGVRP